MEIKKENNNFFNEKLNEAKKELSDIPQDIKVEKKFTAPPAGRKVKIQRITENHLMLVDDKMHGFQVPFEKKYIDAKVGDFIYINF